MSCVYRPCDSRAANKTHTHNNKTTASTQDSSTTKRGSGVFVPLREKPWSVLSVHNNNKKKKESIFDGQPKPEKRRQFLWRATTIAFFFERYIIERKSAKSRRHCSPGGRARLTAEGHSDGVMGAERSSKLREPSQPARRPAQEQKRLGCPEQPCTDTPARPPLSTPPHHHRTITHSFTHGLIVIKAICNKNARLLSEPVVVVVTVVVIKRTALPPPSARVTNRKQEEAPVNNRTALPPRHHHRRG